MASWIRSLRSVRKGPSVLIGKVSPERAVPSHIKKPQYATSGKIDRTDHIYIFSDKAEIIKMRDAAFLARQILDFACALATPGVSTDQIDAITHDEIIRCGAYPSPLRYCGFPKSICTSVNEIACHGIPDDRPLAAGDVLKIDISVYLNGFHGDNCATLIVGDKLDDDDVILMNTTEEALRKAISVCGPGVCLSKIGSTIESVAAAKNLSVVERFCGHGLGKQLHLPPTVLHFENDEKLKLRPGMIFTIEPILAQGGHDVNILEDGWSVQMRDGGRSAQFEHEVLITEHGHEVLTLPR